MRKFWNKLTLNMQVFMLLAGGSALSALMWGLTGFMLWSLFAFMGALLLYFWYS